MNETKRKILDTSRALFNEYGIADVSQRRIADQLGISPGNLTYHFKRSDDIVEALYFELVAGLNLAMETLKARDYNLENLLRSINLLVERFHDYRFILLDFVQIMRRHDPICRHYAQLSVMRKQQFSEAVQHLRQAGIMREEELPHEFDFLYERFHILADFWLSTAEIREGGIRPGQLHFYKQVIIQTLYPYLTEQGKKEFLLIYNKN